MPFSADTQVVRPTNFKELNMKYASTMGTVVASALVLLTGCAGMTAQEKGTATGAVVGGVAGSVLCGGGLLCTGAGAAVGGVIGHEVTKK